MAVFDFLETIYNTLDKDTSPRKRANTFDFTKPRFGNKLTIIPREGTKIDFTGWGPLLRRDDFILILNRAKTVTRYKVTSINHDGENKISGQAVFAPRKK